MTTPMPTPTSLAFDWGDAYLLSPLRDRWVALRRDGPYFLVAETLTELETLIIADCQSNPVPREFDPPGAADYLR